jgi:hypothetical protein
MESGLPPLLDAPIPTYPAVELPLGPAQTKDRFAFPVTRSTFSLCILDSVVLAALNDITEVSTAISLAIAGGRASIHPVTMDELIINIQYRLLEAPFEAYSDLNNASRYASLLYLKTLRRSSDLHWTSVHLSDRLQTALRYMIPYDYPMQLLCWMCFMGLFGSMPGSDYWRQFAKTLIDWYTSRRGRRPDWPSLREELMQIAWIPAAHDEPAQAQWQLVENIVVLGQ